MILENIATTLLEIRDELRKLNSEEAKSTKKKKEVSIDQPLIEPVVTPPAPTSAIPTPAVCAPAAPTPPVPLPTPVAPRVLGFEELSRIVKSKADEFGYDAIMDILNKYGVSKLKDLKSESQSLFLEDINQLKNV